MDAKDCKPGAIFKFKDASGNIRDGEVMGCQRVWVLALVTDVEGISKSGKVLLQVPVDVMELVEAAK
jgi:hypothetical protein